MTRVSDPDEKKDSRSPCNAGNRRHLHNSTLKNSFQAFTERFSMNNPNQSSAQEAPKTSPQSDNKPAPQQQQQGQGDEKKPDQQQQK
jgi:hypothetical protein